tara:strand:- start:2055 stop:2870 length:816 start_codon:yes stop_codon:yes gene_type:complete
MMGMASPSRGGVVTVVDYTPSKKWKGLKMEEKVLAIPAARQDEVLRYLGLDPNDVATEALVQICNRYGLDPLLKHVVLIGDKGRKNTYITRDGLLFVAHQSRQLDGIAVLEEGSDSSEWWAVVEVYRKDMSHPFRYRGRYSKSSMNKKYGPEMAVKCAEVMALRRAFNVALPTIEEQWDTLHDQVGDVVVLQEHHVPEHDVIPLQSDDDAEDTWADAVRISKIKHRLNSAGGHKRREFRDKFGSLDTLDTEAEMKEAYEWVDHNTSAVEPF